MTLSAADLEWIRRLPAQPPSEAAGALRALRIRASAADEQRLLDSLLAPLDRIAAQQSERKQIERRLAVLDEALSDEGRLKAQRASCVGGRLIADRKAEAARRLPSALDLEIAVAESMRALNDRHKAMEDERNRLSDQLREL